MAMYDFDLMVIGAGQGGLPAAHMAANLGANVALIEMGEVGGPESTKGAFRPKRCLGRQK